MSLYFDMSKLRDIEGLGRLAARQWGRVTRAQLHLLGFSDATIHDWTQRALLVPRQPRVYAFGYVSTASQARLWEAILYAGPGAMLSHVTAAQWQGLIKYAPQAIHISTPRKIASRPAIIVHARRSLERYEQAGLPVTAPGQTLLDLATQRPELLPRALSQLDYRGLGLHGAHSAAAGGAPGAGALQSALASYDPGYANLNDEFEFDFYGLCREWGVEPLPIPNVEVAPGLTVDALWPEHNLGVELDGQPNHSSPAQLLRDAERDLICRSLGLTVIRYRRTQLTHTPTRVRDDLLSQLERHAPSARPGTGRRAG